MRGMCSLSVLPSGLEPAWLPGDVEVQVSGETFRTEAIRQRTGTGRAVVRTWLFWSLNQVTLTTTAR